MEKSGTDTVRQGIFRKTKSPITAEEIQGKLGQLLRDSHRYWSAAELIAALERYGIVIEGHDGQSVLVEDLSAVFLALGLRIGIVNHPTQPEFILFGPSETPRQTTK